MTFQAPKGVSEYVPPRGALFEEVSEAFASSARRACYAAMETAGPAFRYERPQAGRYRQFYQVDLEAIGTQDPAVDAETIAVAWDAYRALGLRQYTLLLNSLGDKTCRPVYREALQRFLRGLDLDEDARQRIELN